MSQFPVKYIHSEMRGAPVLSGSPGSLIAVLDAFLITGFGLVTAQAVTVQDGVATATLNAGETFERGAVIAIDGAAPAGLNGLARVASASGTQITWATSAPDGPASGVITIKVAPVGQWEKVFWGPNKAVYRSNEPGASGMYVRVDDSGNTSARVRCYAGMSDVDSGTNATPLDSQLAGGGWILKSYYAASNSPYYLAADGRFVHLGIASCVSYSKGNDGVSSLGFGDFIALAPSGDAWACGVSVDVSNDYSEMGKRDLCGSDGLPGVYLLRDRSGLGGAVAAQIRSYVGSGKSGADGTLGGFPSDVNGYLYLGRVFARSNKNGGPRADVPGLIYVPQIVPPGLLSGGDIVEGTGEYAGRQLVVLTHASSYGVRDGVYLLDTTGPWRP